MNLRSASWLLLVASGCAGGLSAFDEKEVLDSGTKVLELGDDNNAADTGFTGSGGGSSNGGSGSGSSGGDAGTGGDTSGGDTSGGDTSGGDTSGGDTSGGDTSGGSGSDTSGGSGSGSSGGSTGGGSTGGGSTGGSTTPTRGTGRLNLEYAYAEYYPGYYPCDYVLDGTFTASSVYCPGCDFVMDSYFTYNPSASYMGASYCPTISAMSGTLAHDSDYLGSLSAMLYYSPYGYWLALDYSDSYSSGNWRANWGYRDYPYGYWYYYSYTNYITMSATLY